MQKVIPLSEALRLFPDFRPQWREHHPDCVGPAEDVAVGHPKFATIRRVVVCECDENGNPIKALYDKIRFEEGPAGGNIPGSIIVPYFHRQFSGKVLVGLRQKERPTRQKTALEFSQGYAQAGETPEQCALRELAEETNIDNVKEITLLIEICPEPDWFPRGTQIVSIQVTEASWDKSKNLEWFNLDNLSFTQRIDAATSLAALMRFINWCHLHKYLTPGF